MDAAITIITGTTRGQLFVRLAAHTGTLAGQVVTFVRRGGHPDAAPGDALGGAGQGALRGHAGTGGVMVCARWAFWRQG